MKETGLRYYLTTDLPNKKAQLAASIITLLQRAGYGIVEINTDKPWGAYIRIRNDQADDFVHEFFPGLSLGGARLGIKSVELSPKILIVSPGQRLSWQYHYRRAELWTFLTQGSYSKSLDDEPGEPVIAEAGSVVQFEKGERHRLNGMDEGYVVVVEIWQHTDPASPSDEDDIVRLYDDYAR